MSHQTPPVLIVGYKRSQNIKSLLELAISLGSPQIYVALDGPRSFRDKEHTDRCLQVVIGFQTSFPGLIQIKASKENLGCAVSVLSACDWVFDSEDFVAVIEDDCLPTQDFFKFLMDAKEFLTPDSRAMLICGTQFAPESITAGSWLLSSYPLIWGWATSSPKWNQLRELILTAESMGGAHSGLSKSEFAYWSAGSRRALEGYVDAWDTPLVFGMRLRKAYAILPSENLVLNSGNDEYATHTIGKSHGIGAATKSYVKVGIPPRHNQNLDAWLANHYYGIKKRHLISTKVTQVLDYFGINKKNRVPLQERWS